MLCFLGACLTVPLAWADTEFATLALEGDVAPGLATAFSGFDAPQLAGSHYAFNGYTGFSGSAINPQRTGLFVGRGLTYQALLLDNDEAPGAPGTHFRLAPNGFAPSRLTQISADGSLAFTGELVGTSVNSTLSDSLNQRGIWSTTFGALALEMRSNNPTPVFGAGWRFSLPGAVALNADNSIAFWAAAKRGSFPTTETKFALLSRDFGATDFSVLYENSMAISNLPTTFLQAQGSVATGQVIDLPAPSFNALGPALVMRWENGIISVPGLAANAARFFNHADASLAIEPGSDERILAGTLINEGLVEQTGVVTLSGGRIQTGNKNGRSQWKLGVDVLVDANGGHFDNVEGGELVVTAGVAANIAADFVNHGTVFLEDGSSLNVSGTVAQNSLGILTAGRWWLGVDSRLSLAGGPIEKIGTGAEVFLSADSDFDGLQLAANDGALFLGRGASIETSENFTNAGTMQVDLASALSVNGTFDNAGELRGHGTQIQTGKLDNRGLMVLDNGASLQAQRFATNSGQMELRQAAIDGGQIFANAPGAVLILDKENISAAVLSLQGTLRGSGVLNGEVHQFGNLAPGQSLGTIVIDDGSRCLRRERKITLFRSRIHKRPGGPFMDENYLTATSLPSTALRSVSSSRVSTTASSMCSKSMVMRPWAVAWRFIFSMASCPNAETCWRFSTSMALSTTPSPTSCFRAWRRASNSSRNCLTGNSLLRRSATHRRCPSLRPSRCSVAACWCWLDCVERSQLTYPFAPMPRA